MKDWLKNLKNKLPQEELDPKQIFLGTVIFIVAVIFLALAFQSEDKNTRESNTLSKVITNKLNNETRHNRVANIVSSPESQINALLGNKKIAENVTLNITITLDRDMEYKIYYTTKSNESFNQENMVSYPGKEGTHIYSIPLPVSQISRFSIEFEDNAGNIAIKDISLSGSQEVSLNQFDAYEFFQIENLHMNEDNSIGFTSYSPDPTIAYSPSLIAEEETSETEEAQNIKDTSEAPEATDKN